MRSRVMPWYLGLLLTTAVAACGNPCDDLVNKICGCNANDTAVTACKNRVGTDTINTSPSAAQKDQCASLLSSCTCSALACGNYAACGLAKSDANLITGAATCK